MASGLTVVQRPRKTIEVAPRNYIVNERFELSPRIKDSLRSLKPKFGFGVLSEAVYFRTYSRLKEDGTQEQWADTVIRVVEGVMSIRKDWYKNVLGKRWDDKKYQTLAAQLAGFIFEMKILPPGRGLWAMGTDYVFHRGSMALNNCGAVVVRENLSDPVAWTADALMSGVGVGFGTHLANLPQFKVPQTNGFKPPHVIPDSREGWADSFRLLIETYEKGLHEIHFDYSAIRPKGAPIRSFGGTAAGPEMLIAGHEAIRGFLDDYAAGKTSQTRLIADVMNMVGHSIVSGNVRQSAELAIGRPGDEDFIDLKNYGTDLGEENEVRGPAYDRRGFGYVSNNSIALSERDDFQMLPEIADRIRDNGEPGILNFINARKYGRIGDRMEDDVVAVNPCAEIFLEDMELCNLVEVFPTKCSSDSEIYEAMRLATFYASTVSLLRSHSPETNEVVSRNRRIGVSVSGIADWIDTSSVSHVFNVLNTGYEQVVRPTNKKLAKEAGVPESIRVTTVKPSGTISLLAGVSPGMHHPFDGYVLRRMRISKDSPVTSILSAAGVPHEEDVMSQNTEVFEFPLHYGQGRTRSVKNVSIFEQAALVAMLQKSWADNAVSNTLTVQPHEFGQIEKVLAYFAPQVKSLSLLPDTEVGAYAQMPLEKISKDEFGTRRKAIAEPEWQLLTGQDGQDSKYCNNDSCEV